ncbi:MAG TPA: glycine cleavage system protein GcvH [Bacteroidota bacterium]|jgi:glycine cleavage system H protein|nr:glycine cleavage system protein GcvH [Bacteroidota bacterium]
MNFPENLLYSKEHEWIRVEGGIGVVGITDYAQSELGDVVFVELPAPGKQLNQGESFGAVEAVKAVSDLYSPVSGEVTEVNPGLEKTPEHVNQDPYNAGWMVKINIKDKNELSRLLDVKKYRELIGK